MWLFSRETSSLVFILQSTRNGRGKSQISNWGRNHYFCSLCSKQRLNCVDLLRIFFVYHQVHLYDLSGGEVKQRSSELFGRCVEGVWQSTVVVYGREYCFTRHGVTSIIPVSYILCLILWFEGICPPSILMSKEHFSSFKNPNIDHLDSAYLIMMQSHCWDIFGTEYANYSTLYQLANQRQEFRCEILHEKPNFKQLIHKTRMYETLPVQVKIELLFKS